MRAKFHGWVSVALDRLSEMPEADRLLFGPLLRSLERRIEVVRVAAGETKMVHTREVHARVRSTTPVEVWVVRQDPDDPVGQEPTPRLESIQRYMRRIRERQGEDSGSPSVDALAVQAPKNREALMSPPIPRIGPDPEDSDG